MLRDIFHFTRSSWWTPVSRASECLDDSRAVSVTVDAALGIFILLLLTTALTIGVTDVVDSRNDAAQEDRLRGIADEVASGVVSADMLAENANDYSNRAGAGGTETTRVRVTVPDDIDQESYTVIISPSSSGEVTIRVATTEVVVTRTVAVENSVPVGYSGSSQTLVLTIENDEMTIDSV